MRYWRRLSRLSKPRTEVRTNKWSRALRPCCVVWLLKMWIYYSDIQAVQSCGVWCFVSFLGSTHSHFSQAWARSCPCSARLRKSIRQGRCSDGYFGPGATNLITGLADAQIDSTPIVCITGQVFAHLLGTDAFQEADVINTTISGNEVEHSNHRSKGHCVSGCKSLLYSEERKTWSRADWHHTKNGSKWNDRRVWVWKVWPTSERIKPKPVLQVSQIDEAMRWSINQSAHTFWRVRVFCCLVHCWISCFSERRGFRWQVLCLDSAASLQIIPIMLDSWVCMETMAECQHQRMWCADRYRNAFRWSLTGNVSKYAKQAKVIHIDIENPRLIK